MDFAPQQRVEVEVLEGGERGLVGFGRHFECVSW